MKKLMKKMNQVNTLELYRHCQCYCTDEYNYYTEKNTLLDWK
ncbi:unnamed protein product [marine sediment metagenome]|uniref:Uncharacterized protein n=1 Tax=marine sediment metagenome TaxID=412755 RepID=X1D4I2_9ZZZZ